MAINTLQKEGINVPVSTVPETGYSLIQNSGTPFYNLNILRDERDTHKREEYPFCRYTVINGKPHYCMRDFTRLLDVSDTGTRNAHMVRYGVVKRSDVVLLDDPVMRPDFIRAKSHIWLGTENWLEKKIIQSLQYKRQESNCEDLMPELEERLFRELLGKDLRIAPAYKDLIPEELVDNPMAVDVVKLAYDRMLKHEAGIMEVEAEKSSWFKIWDYIPRFLSEIESWKPDEEDVYVTITIAGDILSPVERRRIAWLLHDMEAPLKKKVRRQHFTSIETKEYRGITIPKWLLPEIHTLRPVIEQKIKILDEKLDALREEQALAKQQYEEYKIRKPWEKYEEKEEKDERDSESKQG